MPQSGHRAGSGPVTTSGCIGRAYLAVGAAVGSSFMPQPGQRAGSVLVTSGVHGADVDNRGAGVDVGGVHVHLGGEGHRLVRVGFEHRAYPVAFGDHVRVGPQRAETIGQGGGDVRCGDGDLGQRVGTVGGVVLQRQHCGLGELHVDDDPLRGARMTDWTNCSCS